VERGGWDAVRQALLVRSGGLCEGRTPACLAPGGRLDGGAGVVASVQHRQARGMGGSRSPGVHELANLLIFCGDGVRGCHGWTECGEREAARLRGLWVVHGVDPVRVCLELWSGRLVSLEGPFYADRGWVLPGMARPVTLPHVDTS
jgi:hypothetical protein